MSQSASYQTLMPAGQFDRQHDEFKPRQAQCEMAQAVETCLQDNARLVVESGTGTGKTFAYLVPILLTEKRTIISTATKHLQEQIFHRDLPMVCQTLKRRVDAVLLKGRANYLCRYRLNLNRSQSDLIGSSATDSFDIIDKWAATTRSGDIAEVGELSEHAPIWRQVTSTADNCLGGKCPDFKRCFLMQARQRALQAEVVVVNHHLFFSDLSLKSEGVSQLLPNYAAVVFDEAHGLAEIASHFFGFSISNYQLQDLVDDIQASEKQEQSGARFKQVTPSLETTLSKLRTALKPHDGQSLDFASIDKNPYRALFDSLRDNLIELEALLAVAAAAGEGLQRCHQRCLRMQEQLDTWRSGTDRNLIRWLQVSGNRIRLHVTPLSVVQHFDQLMDKADTAWVFTSATLAVGARFDAFCQQLGLQEAHSKQWQSPFNFAHNALLYLPPGLPEPRAADFATALAETILQTVALSNGRTFCLFTSFAMMQKLHNLLEAQLSTSWPVLLQGQAPKSDLLQRFVELKNAVLFGTASFWEGVDVKGDSLSCVIIDKLPFAPPNNPVLQSRLAFCQEEGGNPFVDIQLPAAVIAFKQGAGRLIRSETDQGVLVVCDSRLTSKPYGTAFLDSLPPMPRTQRHTEVERFFARTRSPV